MTIQVLPPFPKLPPFDFRHRFGLHDDVKEEVGKKVACFQEGSSTQCSLCKEGGVGVRHCNWLRFLRLNLLMDDAVNIIGTKASSGEPLFEVTSTKLVLIHL